MLENRQIVRVDCRVGTFRGNGRKRAFGDLIDVRVTPALSHAEAERVKAAVCPICSDLFLGVFVWLLMPRQER